MPCAIFFQTIASRLQRLIGLKSKASASQDNSRGMQISSPFDFKHEIISLPGLSEDEIVSLKEKAAASRVGVSVSGSNNDGSSSFGNPRKAPRAPHSPIRTVTPATQATLMSPHDNVI